ncbi:MAG: regulatory protein RecX [Clostridia bacterium]|nr:regulatory protein RecX [Clostridia bacterium]
MPKITDMQIQKRNKSRANIYIDGEFAFALEMLTVMKLGLKIGKEIHVDTVKMALFDSETSVAFGKAVDYLARAMKTTKQMRDYLTKKGYAPDVVECVIDKLKGYKYLDDETYAKLYTQQSKTHKGQRRIKQELLNKGISHTEVDSQVQIDEDDELATATTLAQKYLKNKDRDIKTMQKLQRFLLYRGFDFDIVNSVIRNFKDVSTDDAD